ncbi:hypothetical protein I7I53_09957 [Histoplasma capsulatum var. duboisii H88]|uniref:Uncharacterized protein n=1 Tax=Ajellomyces capsulatus (strain H88) TaxID=544711 RepID=A0A8A1LA59_AJEC8|nr:hypothetical protein I7I53_09957 [Histoplasma capsulatum var. duboisii H88]
MQLGEERRHITNKCSVVKNGSCGEYSSWKKVKEKNDLLGWYRMTAPETKTTNLFAGGRKQFCVCQASR